MKNVLVTGSSGFIGKNLLEGLGRRKDVIIRTFGSRDDMRVFESYLREADVVYHLAGVNRPQRVEEFATGNTGLTESILNFFIHAKRSPQIIFTSSVQAEFDNPYGKSKKAAEEAIISYHKQTSAPVRIYRLPGVFGKWSRPNYNTVVATFCHNISHGLEIQISDRSKAVELVYIDAVIEDFLQALDGPEDRQKVFYAIPKTFKVTLGGLADRIYQLRDMRSSLIVPDLSDEFMRHLHATYLSFLDKGNFSYPLEVKTDDRGNLLELIKSRHFGQVFVSSSHAGIVRGNHYHNSKIEKFCVIKGKAIIRFRHVLDQDIIEYPVSDEKIVVVDIPPGYTHSIENVSDGEMIVLFWANQIFNPEKPDTYYNEV